MKHVTPTKRQTKKAAAPGYNWPPADPELKARMEALFTAASACIDRASERLSESIDTPLGPDAILQDVAMYSRAALACAEAHSDLAFGRHTVKEASHES